MTTIFLLRHAESAPHKNLPEPEWPLSEQGAKQALEICDFLLSLNIDQIFSSPYKRARETVHPFAKTTGLEINIVHDLRERKLKEGFVDNFQEIVKQAWTDFNFALPNCESSISCQTRFKQCMDSLVEQNADRNILISSHGNAIGLYLNMLDATFGFEEWAKMQNPDLFKIVYQCGSSRWDKTFVYP